MADPNFQYDPQNGWNDPVTFPTTPSKNAVRGLFQKLFDQARDAINAIVPWANAKFATKDDTNLKANAADVYTKTQIDTNQATKAEIQGIVLGQIPVNSLTESVMASDMKKGVVGGVAKQDDLINHINDSDHVGGDLYLYNNSGGVL